jgi:O-antigen/teichoic acid export membrane protein
MSATNFVTVVVLARTLPPADFGAFVLAYASLLFANGLQTGLVTQPHNVLGQGRSGEDYRSYTRSTAVGQGLFSGAAALVALAVAAGAKLAGGDASGVLVALVPALVAWQLQEFVRRVLYTEHRFGTAFAVDVVSYGGQVALVLALVWADRASAAAALYAVAVSSGAGALVGGWAVRRSLRGRVRRAFLAENWAFGKWLGAAIAASWLSGWLFFYLTAVIVSASATAALKASQTVLGPLNAFLLFLVTILPISLASVREREGDAALGAELRASYLASGPIVFSYCAVVAIFATPILETLYGTAYGAYGDAVRLFAVYYVVIHAAYVVSAALSARRQTKPLFAGNVCAAVVGVAVGWPLVQAWEVNGAVVGMILSAVVLTAFFWRAYRASVPGVVAHPVDGAVAAGRS